MPKKAARNPDSKIIDWLLEEENPSVRYFALRDLSGSAGAERRTSKTPKKQIMTQGVVPKILARQNAGGLLGGRGQILSQQV